MRKFFWLLSTIVLLASLGWAQNACVPGQAITSRQGFSNLAAVVPGATVVVSPGPIFTVPSGGTPIAGNTITADNFGNFSFCAAWASNQTVTISGPNFNTLVYTVTMPNGAAAVLATGNNTFTGSNSFTGNTSLATTTVKTLNTKVYADQQAGATADVQILNAIAALPATGGIVDTTGYAGTTPVLANCITIGTGFPKRVVLLADSSQTWSITATGNCDVLALAEGSSLECVKMSLPTFANGGGFQLAATASIRSIVAPASRTGSQNTIVIRGCSFLGNASATVSGALVDLQGVASNTILQDLNIWNPYNTIGLRIIAPTLVNTIDSDIEILNVQSNGGNVAGARPCVLTGNGAGTLVADVNFTGGSCQHAGSGQYELEINGNDGGASDVRMEAITFRGTHVESATGSLGILIKDAQNVLFDGSTMSGAGTGNSFTLAETFSGLLKGISIKSIYTASNATNYIVNSAAGGTTIVTVGGVQPDYQFKVNNLLSGGTLASNALIAVGANPTLTGTGACATTTTQSGGQWGGQFTCTGTTGASTVTITFATTAAHAWACSSSDVTHTLAGSQVTPLATTACTMNFTSVTSSDVLTFSATQY